MDNLGAVTKDWCETVRLQEDRRDPVRKVKVRRREDRLELDATAKLCKSMWGGVKGHVIDLSTYGCSFLNRFGTFKPGDEVWLRIDGLQPWSGIVRWVNDNKVGIEFLKPFYTAIVEHLVKSNQTIECKK